MLAAGSQAWWTGEQTDLPLQLPTAPVSSHVVVVRPALSYVSRTLTAGGVDQSLILEAQKVIFCIDAIMPETCII